jgi:protein translocase SecG subunit
MILGMEWYHTILAFFFAVLAILLMIVILLQRGKGVGLAGVVRRDRRIDRFRREDRRHFPG